MSTRKLLILLVPLVVIAGLLISNLPPLQEPADSSVSSGIVYDADVERVVQQFGLAMKDVSLLANETDLRAGMEGSYGQYVAPELIDAWIADPAQAPGRQTSSPWPDSINIGNMEGDAQGFVVNGTVAEVANTDRGLDIVGTYPVKLRLERRGSAWLIYDFERGAYSPIPARSTTAGTYTCLPHRDTSGPQTMECAFGLRADSGEHYALDMGLMSSTAWMEMPTGARVRVSGVMTPIEMLSTDQWQKYDIVGIISATAIEAI